MIDIEIKDIDKMQSTWLHFDTYNEAVNTIKSALIIGYVVCIKKAEKE